MGIIIYGSPCLCTTSVHVTNCLISIRGLHGIAQWKAEYLNSISETTIDSYLIFCLFLFCFLRIVTFDMYTSTWNQHDNMLTKFEL